MEGSGCLFDAEAGLGLGGIWLARREGFGAFGHAALSEDGGLIGRWGVLHGRVVT